MASWICSSAVFHHPTVSLSFPVHSARLLHAGQNRASVQAPIYSCAGVFHLVKRQTDLPKEGEEGVMGNTLGGPLQEDAQQGA